MHQLATHRLEEPISLTKGAKRSIQIMVLSETADIRNLRICSLWEFVFYTSGQMETKKLLFSSFLQRSSP